MNDLFQCTCPHCGQPLPDQSVTETTKDGSFAKFWASIPKGTTKGSKKNAEKAWHKLTAQEQALAAERAPVFYTLTPDERFGALGLHVSTFLNGGHYEEEVIAEKMKRRQEKAAYDPRQMAAKNIKSGKRFLCTNITPTKARTLIADGLVTEDECRKVGVL
jgi:hypothetical protein